MASIVDSIRSVYTDRFSTLKMGVFSYAVYFLVSMYVPTAVHNPLNFLLILLIFFLYSGFCAIIVSNRINQRIEVLPTLDLVKYFRVCVQSFLLSIPFFVIGIFVVGFVLALFRFEALPQQISLWLVRFVVFCSFISAFINFSENYSMTDGLNLPKLMNGLADVIVYTIVCLLLLAIYSIFLAVPTLFLLYTFFKFGPLFQYGASFFLTLNLAFMADYWGQLHYDIKSKDNYY